MLTVFWTSLDSTRTITITKDNNEIMTLNVGDFITYEGRPDGVKITQFTYKDSDPRGPIGLIYLPWRTEGKWATPIWNLKGNPRHLIAFPVGREHYGEQIDWNTIQLVNGGVCPDETPLVSTSVTPSA
jgi:hypothetical protein